MIPSSYQLATEDMAAAMRFTRNDPAAKFMALAVNRQLSSVMSDREYGNALRHQCDRRGARMYRQLEEENPTSNIGHGLQVTKVIRKVKKVKHTFFALEHGGIRVVLDLGHFPSVLRSLLPESWPTAEAEEFLPFWTLCLDADVAQFLVKNGVMEAAL